jgi:hypothetical protein
MLLLHGFSWLIMLACKVLRMDWLKTSGTNCALLLLLLLPLAVLQDAQPVSSHGANTAAAVRAALESSVAGWVGYCRQDLAAQASSAVRQQGLAVGQGWEELVADRHASFEHRDEACGGML